MDGDGDLDLAVLSLQGLRMLENKTPKQHFLRVRVEPPAYGAVVQIGASQIDRVRLTAGFHTQMAPELHFGLGAATEVPSIELRWPDGTKQRFGKVKADQLVVLRRGATEPELRPLKAWPPTDRPTSARFDLSLRTLDLRGFSHPLGAPGRAAVINFWGPSCKACIEEMPALAALNAEHGKVVRFAAISVEEDPAAVEAFANKYGVGLPIGLATQELIRSFFGGTDRIPLPSTFVFDQTGSLRRAFYRKIEGPEIDRILKTSVQRTAPDDAWQLALRLAREDKPQAFTRPACS